jgi:hypothetical protein
MRPWSSEFAGRFDEVTIETAALRGDPLGESAERQLWAYLPPGYDGDPARRYPSIYLIQGYTGTLEIGTLEIGTLEIGTLEIGTLEIGTLEIGTLEIGTLEIGTLEMWRTGRRSGRPCWN